MTETYIVYDKDGKFVEIYEVCPGGIIPVPAFEVTGRRVFGECLAGGFSTVEV